MSVTTLKSTKNESKHLCYHFCEAILVQKLGFLRYVQKSMNIGFFLYSELGELEKPEMTYIFGNSKPQNYFQILRKISSNVIF